MYKLILTDLDHTLLRSDGTISDDTLFVIRQCRNRGIKFGIATARFWIGAERYIEQLKPDFEITTDGTVIHSNGECIYSCSFSVEETNQIIKDLIRAVPDAEITVACGKEVLWNSLHIEESERLYKATYYDYREPVTCAANKIVVSLSDEKIAMEIVSKYHCKLQCYRGENWYSFIPGDSGKVQAISALKEICNISPDEIVSFGDDRNDLDMLCFCGIGVAVDNAITEVKEIADYITSSNDDEGVANWLINHILKC